MGFTTNLFVTCFTILLLTNISLFFIYPDNAYLSSIGDLNSTAFIITILVVLVICSITALTIGLTDAKPIIALVVIIALLYQINIFDVIGDAINLDLSAFNYELGYGLVSNLIDFLEGTDFYNIGFILINGLGFMTLITCVMSALDSGEA